MIIDTACNKCGAPLDADGYCPYHQPSRTVLAQILGAQKDTSNKVSNSADTRDEEYEVETSSENETNKKEWLKNVIRAYAGGLLLYTFICVVIVITKFNLERVLWPWTFFALSWTLIEATVWLIGSTGSERLQMMGQVSSLSFYVNYFICAMMAIAGEVALKEIIIAGGILTVFSLALGYAASIFEGD